MKCASVSAGMHAKSVWRDVSAPFCRPPAVSWDTGGMVDALGCTMKSAPRHSCGASTVIEGCPTVCSVARTTQVTHMLPSRAAGATVTVLCPGIARE
jgi:hypothetical protein